MKRIIGLLLVLAMIFAMTACSTEEAAPEVEKPTDGGKTDDGKMEEVTEPVTIKFATHQVLESSVAPFWEQVEKDFETAYPNIDLEYVSAPYGEMMNTVINMAGGGDVVDIMLGEIDWIPGYEDAGITVPVADVLSEGFVNDYYDGVLDAFKIGDDVYGVPMYISPFILYYNKDLFEQAGLDPNTPPTTYEEMMVAAEALAKLETADGNKVYAFGQTTASVPVSGAALVSAIYNFGGDLLDAEGNLVTDSQGVTDYFVMLDEIHAKGYTPENAKLKDLRNLFALGQLGMYYDQSWGYNNIRGINPDAKDFIASAAPLAGGSGTGEAILNAHTLMFANNSEAQVAASRTFVEWLLTPEVMSPYLKDLTPAYPAKNAMESVEVNPILATSLDAIESAKAITFIPQLTDVYLEVCALAQAITVGDSEVEAAVADFLENAEDIIG